MHCCESLNHFLTIAIHNEIKLDNSIAGEESIICHITRITGETSDNFYVVLELFPEGVYNIHIKTDKIVVCDVGMKAGIASLYFAALPGVSKVYGYKPFPETYQHVVNNFDLIPSLRDKIIPNNARVGARKHFLKYLL